MGHGNSDSCLVTGLTTNYPQITIHLLARSLLVRKAATCSSCARVQRTSAGRICSNRFKTLPDTAKKPKVV